MRRTIRRGERGFSILEVLVASVVLVIGFLGVANLQYMASRSGQSARRSTQATALAGEVLARLISRPMTDTSLVDQTTTNDTMASAYDMEAVGAKLDYCVTQINGQSIPAPDSQTDRVGGSNTAFASCQTGGGGGGTVTVNGIATAAEWAPTTAAANGLGVFFIGYNVEDVAMPTGTAKVIVARVLWRDPATGHMRSTSAMGIKNPPPKLDLGI